MYPSTNTTLHSHEQETRISPTPHLTFGEPDEQINVRFLASFNSNMGLATINIERGFMNKCMFIAAALQNNNIAIAVLCDLGLQPQELEKHFINKGEGKWLAKPYVLQGYQLVLNIEEDESWVAIATCNDKLDINRVHVTYGLPNNRGRCISLKIPLSTGEDLMFMGVYGPPRPTENGEFMQALVERIWEHKVSDRLIIVAGDLNMDKYNLSRNNLWCRDLDSFLADSRKAWSGSTFEPSWWADGRPGTGYILDYILVDHELVDKCVWSGMAMDMNSLSDHCMVTTRIKIAWSPPDLTEPTYSRVMDVNKLTADIIPELQEDVCDMANTYIPILHDIQTEEPSITKAMEFNMVINQMSSQLQTIASKWCPPDKTSRSNHALPTGYTKEIRNINQEIKKCRSAMSKLSELSVEGRHLHHTSFTTKVQPNPTRPYTDRWTWKTQVLQQQKMLREKRKVESHGNKGCWKALKEAYAVKLAALRLKVAETEHTLQEPIPIILNDSEPTELANSGLTPYSINYLLTIGITKWSQLTNWDGSDLMSLYTLRTITKATRIGIKGWAKASETFRNTVRQTAPAARLLGELEEGVTKDAVLLIVHAEQGVVASDTSGVIPVSWRPTAQKWLQKINIEHEFCEAAILAKKDKVDSFLLGLTSIGGTMVKCQIAETHIGNEVVKTVTNNSVLLWNTVHQINLLDRLNTGEQKLLTQLTPEQEQLGETILSTNDWLAKLQLHRMNLKTKAAEHLKSAKQKRIQKATARQIHNLRKNAKKFIRKRRALMEGNRAKLNKLLIDDQWVTDKNTILKETEKFFIETGKEIPTANSTRFKFLETCYTTTTQPSPESVEMLIADITISEVVAKIFHASNNTAPGRDGIPYDLLKRMPDCFFQMLTIIFNIIWVHGYCPSIWSAGDVFLLPKTQDPETLKQWRPIGLQAVIYKVLTAIISDRMLNFALINNIISTEQKGFCPVSGCVDHVGLLLNAIENFRQTQGELYLIFIDFCNAYGTVSHQRLLEVLQALRFPNRITDFFGAVMQESSYVIHTAVGETPPITLFTGLKQGDPSSLVLFILFIEALIRVLKDQCKGFEFKYPFDTKIDPLGIMAFADDFLLLSDNMPDVNAAIMIIEDFENWSGMRINHGKCAVMATASNGQKIVDIPVTFEVRNTPLPYYTQDTAYKYLGFFESINGNQNLAVDHITTKLNSNISLIDAMGVSPWDKMQLAAWLLAAIPMYYLIHGRLRKGEIKKLSVKARKAIRLWLKATAMCSSVIHLPRMMHGLGIADFQDVDEERKLTTFSQFLHSNDSNLRDSTVANLQLEWHKRRWVIDRDNVLVSPSTIKTASPRRAFTLWHSLEPLLRKQNLALRIRYPTTNCFCALPAETTLEIFTCRICKMIRHKRCDPRGSHSLRCCICIKNIQTTPNRDIVYTPTRYQDHRYNWREQVHRRTNPMWDWLLSHPCKGESHCLYRLENGVWGVQGRTPQWDETIQVDIPLGMSTTNVLYVALQTTKNKYQGGRVRVLINHQLAITILSNWMFKWANSYQRSSAGMEPMTWTVCKMWLDFLENIRPGWVLFELWEKEQETVEFEPEQLEDGPATHPKIWIHKGGIQLTPPMLSKYVKDQQAEKWMREWPSKSAQGVLPRANPHTITSTAAFLTNQLVSPAVAVTFLKASLDLLPTRARKHTWGYIDSPACFLCSSPYMNIWHIMCACPMLNGFYKRRHNKVLSRIAQELVELENLGIITIDKQWDTITPWKYNMPDIVLLAPHDQTMLPEKWKEILEPADSVIVDLAVCADRHLEERFEYKCKKYEPLAAIINVENHRAGVETGALVFGVMGSVHVSVDSTLRRLGLSDKQLDSTLKDINAILADECHNIWCYIRGLDQIEL